MQAFATLIGAFSTLLWPLIVVAVLIILRLPMTDLIRSAGSRKFTIKIGGQELSMNEASEQQRVLIADLQAQIAELRIRTGITNPAQALAQPTQIQHAIQALSSVLWVDDEPKNNSYFIEELGRLGVRVDLARSTSEGLSMFGSRRYGVIISDMGRRENGKDNFRAGLDFLKAIRERDAQIPFVIFCSSRGAQEHRDEAMRLGASGITASAAELYAILNLEQLTKQVSK